MFTWSCDPIASPSRMMTHRFQLLKQVVFDPIKVPEWRVALHETITKLNSSPTTEDV